MKTANSATYRRVLGLAVFPDQWGEGLTKPAIRWCLSYCLLAVLASMRLAASRIENMLIAARSARVACSDR